MSTWHTSGKWYTALQCQLKKKIGVWWSKLKQKFWLFFVEPKGYIFRTIAACVALKYIYLFIARREIIHLIIHFIFMLVDHIASFGSDRRKPPLMIGTKRKRPLMSFSWKRPCHSLLWPNPSSGTAKSLYYKLLVSIFPDMRVGGGSYKQKEKKIIKSELCCFFFLS